MNRVGIIRRGLVGPAFTVCFVLLFIACRPAHKSNDVIRISGSFALFPLMEVWTEEYQQLHPEVQFDVKTGGASRGMEDLLSGAVDIAMYSANLPVKAQDTVSTRSYAVAKEAVVAVVNASNPNLDLIKQEGLSLHDFRQLFLSNNARNWKDLLKDAPADCGINKYTRSDACGAANSWAAYLGGTQDQLQGVGVYGDPGILTAVSKDKLGLSYLNACYAFDVQSGKQHAGIMVVPIDLNGNGRIDAREAIYDSLPALVEAVENGRYPSPPACDLYLITRQNIRNPHITAFLQWTLHEGQAFIHKHGYVPLPVERLKAEQNKFTPQN